MISFTLVFLSACIRLPDEKGDDTGEGNSLDTATDTETGITDSDTSVNVDTDTGTVVDTAETDPNCAFTAYRVDNQEAVATTTYPSAWLRLGTEEMTVTQGDTAEFTWRVGAVDGCGRYQVREFVLFLNDYAPQSAWIEDYINGRAFASLNMGKASLGQNCAPTGGYGLDENGEIIDCSLVYGWITPESGWDSAGASIPSQVIVGDDPQNMTFSFDTQFVPAGTTLTVTFFMGWNTMDGTMINPVTFTDAAITLHVQ